MSPAASTTQPVEKTEASRTQLTLGWGRGGGSFPGNYDAISFSSQNHSSGLSICIWSE